jgi:hypothetical protein
MQQSHAMTALEMQGVMCGDGVARWALVTADPGAREPPYTQKKNANSAAGSAG